MQKFELFNPILKGNVQTVVESKNADDAAKQIWSNVSEYIEGVVPKFAFTIKNLANNKFYNYKVSESLSGGGNEVAFKLSSFKLNNDTLKKVVKSVNAFQNILNDYNEEDSSLSGGSETSESKEDLDKKEKEKREKKKLKKLYKKAKLKNYIENQSPIYYWWYNPYVYDVDYVYIPTFVYPVTPYVQIDLGTAWWR